MALVEKLSLAGFDNVLVSTEGYYSAVLDWARASQIDNAERYFLNPQTDESKKAANDKAEKAEKDLSIQMQIAAQAATAEQQAQALANAIKKYEADLDDAYSYWKSTLDAEVKMVIAGVTSAQAEQLQLVGEIASNDATERTGEGAT